MWTRRAYFPTNATLDGTNPQEAVALWYVVYNAKNREYVGYGGQYGGQFYAFTSATPWGPFTVHNALSPVYAGMGDILIYHDSSDNHAYLIYNSMRCVYIVRAVVCGAWCACAMVFVVLLYCLIFSAYCCLGARASGYHMALARVRACAFACVLFTSTPT